VTEVHDGLPHVGVERAGIPQMRESPGEPDEGVLHQVLRDPAVAGEEVGQPHGSGRMLAVQLSDPSSVHRRRPIDLHSHHSPITGPRTQRSRVRFHAWGVASLGRCAEWAATLGCGARASGYSPIA
jgi:hypothetical protein